MDPENKIKLYEPAVRKWERLRPTPAVRAEPLEMKESADLLATGGCSASAAGRS